MNGAKVAFENWHVWVQLIAFVIIFIAFCIFSIKALLMKKDHEAHMASLPLEDATDQQKTSSKP